MFLWSQVASATETSGLIDRLERAVAVMEVDNERQCTATKIAPNTYLTAKHCLPNDSWGNATSIRVVHKDYEYHYVSTVQYPVESEWDQDWAILYTSTDNKDIPSITLSCSEKLYKGQRVAFVGHPGIFTYAYREGYISTLVKPRGDWYRQPGMDFSADMQSEGGASGSAVISLKTGQIIGVLVEGVRGTSITGMEAIRNLSLCRE